MADYRAQIQQLCRKWGTDPARGLEQAQVEALREQYGENRLREGKKQSLLQKFLAQMKDTMVLILLGAAVISFVIALVDNSGEFIDSIIILAIVVLNGILGVRQESKAEHALEALQELSAPEAKTLRGGSVGSVPAVELVPGDIVLLEAGDLVPADGRLLQSASLRCEESALTGESVPVEKDATADIPPEAAIGDRINQVFSGSNVSYGRGVMIITATGMATEMGKIAGLLQGEKNGLTPLQQKLNDLGRVLGIIAIVICAAIFGIGLLQGLNPVMMFMTAVSLAVAAIPEGMTAVVTVVLALGVQRMVKHNAIIRSLPAVETLGSASVICSDKTGTLTQNRMTVQQVWAAGGGPEALEDALSQPAHEVIRMAALCSDGQVEVDSGGEERPIGDPTETAIISAARRLGMEKHRLEEEAPRFGEIPFDSDRKRMTTVHQINGKVLVVVKGGYDVLLPLCKAGDRSRADEVNAAMAEDALRVLAVAVKELDAAPTDMNPESLERDLTFMGLIGMIDPPREESKQAVALCRRAGIRTVMITGDHVITATAIAREIGILDEGGEAISGQELQKLSDDELARKINRYRVYARVSPEDKIRIVKAWQSKGDVVAMTGDGVNDAPALKAADIGCAMGVTGTDVAKGAADLVLTDDNFATIVEAVRSGRGIFDNIKKTIQFLLGSNLGEVFAVFAAMLLGWGAPLLAIHLLLINVVTDALPALALGVEPVDEQIMDRKPVPRNQGIFAGGLGIVILLQGLMVGILTLTAYYIGQFVAISAFIPPSVEVGMTMAFLVLCLSQLSQALNCRSSRSLFRIGLGSNPTMLKAFLGSAAVVVAICLFPPLERMFRLVDISVAHWLLVFGLSLLPLALVEIVKALHYQVQLHQK